MRRKARSLFAVLQIAVAIAAYVSIVGVTKGLQAQFYRIGQVFAFDLIVQSDGAASPVFSSVKLEDVEKVAKVEGVKSASAMGFYYLRGHGVPAAVVDGAFDACRSVHALPLEAKLALKANEHNVGYMPVNGYKSRASSIARATWGASRRGRALRPK